MHELTVKIRMPRMGQRLSGSSTHAFSAVGTGTCCLQGKPRHREVEGGARRSLAACRPVLCAGPLAAGPPEAMPESVVFQHKLRKSFLLK